jgi:hypothetical protein
MPGKCRGNALIINYELSGKNALTINAKYGGALPTAAALTSAIVAARP